MAGPNKIVLKGDPLYKEQDASGTITPGDLVERTGTSVQRHSADGGHARTSFAVELGAAGQDIDEDYSDGERCKYAIGRQGDEFYAWLKDGNNASSVGTELASNGDGKLKIATSTDVVVAHAIETVNASGSDERIKVEAVGPYQKP